MMDKVGIPANIKKPIVDNDEPDANGVYPDWDPDWADPNYVFQHRDSNVAIHWIQNGHPMQSWITESEGMLGVSEKKAEKFSKECITFQRRETAAL
jgi:hypothetical protein